MGEKIKKSCRSKKIVFFLFIFKFPVQICISLFLKFIYSERATKFCAIFTLLLSYVVTVKSKVKISKKFVAFSEYMNFNPISREGQIKTTTSTRLPWIFRPSYGTILCGLLYYIETHYTQAEATKLFKVSEMG